MTFARLRGDNRKGSIMNMSLACRARACPAIAAGCRALRPTARNKASAACPAPSGMKSGRNRCFVDSLRWRKVDLNHRFRAWTRFGFGLPDRHRGVSWLWKSPSRPTDSTGRDRAEVTAAQASQREIFGILQRPPEMGSGFGVAPLAWRRPIDLLRTSPVTRQSSRSACTGQSRTRAART